MKSMHRFLGFSLLSLICLFAHTSYADDKSHLFPLTKLTYKLTNGSSMSLCYYYFNGEINEDAGVDFLTELDNQPCSHFVFVLNSPGGDIYSAMTIGQYFRSREVSVLVGPVPDSTGHLTGASSKGRCASACVLLFMAAVDRIVTAPAIGLHRPYSTQSAKSFEDARKQGEETKQDLLIYFKEMNISPSLLDQMMSVPPEQIKWLSVEDTYKLVPQLDPAWDEFTKGQRANTLGISLAEYYKRRQIAEQTCSRQSSGSFDPRVDKCIRCMENNGLAASCAKP